MVGMKDEKVLLGWLLLAAAGLACGGSGVEAPSNENFARTWHLTKCVYRNEANPAQQVDLVTSGWEVFLYINDTGMFRYSTTPPGGSEQFVDGSWTASGQTVTLTPVGATYSWQFTARVGEESMTLKGGHAEFDFDNDGIPEAATWEMAGNTI